MTLRAALVDALLTTLAAPATWPMALATFLLRGGVLIVALPIVVLPSPVGLGNLLAPTLIDVAFQGVTPAVAVLVLVLLGLLAAWAVVGGLVAGTLESAAARIVVREDVRAPTGSDSQGTAGTLVPARIAAARVIAHLPTAIAFVWASTRLVAVAYRELTSPFDVATPIVLRVLLGAPEAIAVVLVLWVVGESAGALAAREIVARDEGIGHALRRAAWEIVRQPVAVVGAFVVPFAGLLIVLVPAGLATSAAWTAVKAAMQGGGETLLATLLVVGFVGLWVVGLGLIAVISAWRAAVWTVLAPQLGAAQTRAPVREASASH